ncbi:MULTISPECIES: bifunctional adenosylcobinamide kinase/adenosylcobinamide-phosphate guanylyltransferase [unclassified Halomonas]|uniref:bifunctional adenosylcobinamide kinase/adenosylcobinamide-phosphate guanylyltransferase n=1 Tax=unclassified Halomonas TaxID=2609666 RepID=UPI00054AE9F6|nr:MULTISPECIES: bifunctional adenosylcobinamide kinase/adenosylcobinamide-phosphate guanylyltransferase [unclassified Halomonas]KHJ51015.1 adenosylcobinamide kinase [Halomonas hydrothermalis]PJX13952.1 adenosylcobinamide kinase [Halomonas sp. 141]UDM05856.1 bifunctional adenosylcobinamide kinase/adenosylcobinamide-phosphate guanylyltransferase [Halomonas sp. NyZ770]
MQLFIGGASAGKRDAVKQRFPGAVWWRLAPGQRLQEVSHVMHPGTPLVLHGLFEWLSAAIHSDFSSDEWRAHWREDLQRLDEAAAGQHATLVVIANELGRGLVPMARDQRRLRDLSGWFTQDAAAQASQVWYVRHGLVQALKSTA